MYESIGRDEGTSHSIVGSIGSRRIFTRRCDVSIESDLFISYDDLSDWGGDDRGGCPTCIGAKIIRLCSIGTDTRRIRTYGIHWTRKRSANNNIFI